MKRCIEICDTCKKEVCVVKDHFYDFHIKGKKLAPDMTIYRNEKNVILNYYICDQYFECK